MQINISKYSNTLKKYSNIIARQNKIRKFNNFYLKLLKAKYSNLLLSNLDSFNVQPINRAKPKNYIKNKLLLKIKYNPNLIFTKKNFNDFPIMGKNRLSNNFYIANNLSRYIKNSSLLKQNQKNSKNIIEQSNNLKQYLYKLLNNYQINSSSNITNKYKNNVLKLKSNWINNQFELDKKNYYKYTENYFKDYIAKNIYRSVYNGFNNALFRNYYNYKKTSTKYNFNNDNYIEQRKSQKKLHNKFNSRYLTVMNKLLFKYPEKLYNKISTYSDTIRNYEYLISKSKSSYANNFNKLSLNKQYNNIQHYLQNKSNNNKQVFRYLANSYSLFKNNHSFQTDNYVNELKRKNRELLFNSSMASSLQLQPKVEIQMTDIINKTNIIKELEDKISQSIEINNTGLIKAFKEALL